MSTVVKLVAALLCLAGLPVIVVAQEPNHCEWLLKYGIYDTKTWEYDRHNIGHLRTLLQASEAKTYEEFETSGRSLGIDVPTIASFKFGGHDAKSKFLDWKKALLTATDFGAQEHEKLRVVVREISPTLMKAVEKCLDNQPKGKLVGWLSPHKDDLTFTLHLKHNPATAEPCKITSISFLSSTRKVVKLLAGKEAELMKEGAVVPIAGVSASFQRENPTEGLRVTVNTSHGEKFLDVVGVDPNAAIDRLNRKVTDLEAKLAALDQALTKGHLDLAAKIGAVPGVDKLEWLTINTGIIADYREKELPPPAERGQIFKVSGKGKNEFDLSSLIPAGYEVVAAFPMPWDFDVFAKEFDIISVGRGSPTKVTLTVHQGDKKGGALVGFATCLLVKKK